MEEFFDLGKAASLREVTAHRLHLRACNCGRTGERQHGSTTATKRVPVSATLTQTDQSTRGPDLTRAGALSVTGWGSRKDKEKFTYIYGGRSLGLCYHALLSRLVNVQHAFSHRSGYLPSVRATEALCRRLDGRADKRTEKLHGWPHCGRGYQGEAAAPEAVGLPAPVPA